MEVLIICSEDLSRIRETQESLESRFSVRLSFMSLEKSVRLEISGGRDQGDRVGAKNYVESLIQTSLSEDSSDTKASLDCVEGHSSSQESSLIHHDVLRSLSDSEEHKPTKKTLESEDSSYDSDCESKSHEDICRTFSETLASEFSEYVSCESQDPLSSDYAGKVEFALRLGYPEGLLQQALRKLGPSAGQDRILGELIRLQGSNKSSSPPECPVNDSDRQILTPEDSPSPGSGGIKPPGGEPSPFLPIVIDGSNVAMSHGNKEIFSCRGIQLCVNWFLEKGLQNITVFVPRWRKESSKPESPISDQHILTELEKDRILAYTPSRQVGGRRVVCHDDRYILNLAAETGAIVVSNDNYRELLAEKPEYKEVITKRILMYSFVNDRFMPPDDPMGKNGPTLHAFLRGQTSTKGSDAHSSVPCPYGRKCTYGNKCKYYHAERGNQPQKSVTDKLKESSSLRISEVRARVTSRDSSPGDPLTRTVSVNIPPRIRCKPVLCRTQSNIPSRGFEPPKVSSPPRTQHVLHSPHHPHQKVHNSKSFENLPPLSGIPDLSVPPPAWSPSSPSRRHSTTASPSSSGSSGHLKLSRQLSLHPCFDGRLGNRFLIPPPIHQGVSRNASAPDYGALPPVFPPSHNNFTPLNKTLSDSTEWSGAGSENYGPIGSSRKNSSRQKLFIHLKAIFPEASVLAALAALPDETDGQKICEHIIGNNSSILHQ